MIIGIKLLLSWIGNGILFVSIGGQRYQRKALAFYWLAVAVADGVASILLCMLLPSPYGYNSSVWLSMVIMGIAFFYVHKGRTGEKLFRFLCVTCVAAIVGVINETMYPTFGAMEPAFSLLSGPIKIVVCLVLALMYRLFFAQKADQIFRQLEGRWRWVNTTGLVATILCYYITLHYISGELTFHMTAIMVLLTAINYICLLCILYFMSRAIHLAQAEQREELLINQVERLMEVGAQARIMRHDLRHHNLIISTYARKGQVAELQAYLTDYDQSLIDESQTVFCAHTMVNNILEVYSQRAKTAGIAFTTNVELAERCPVGQRDLMGLLSNILENALHGAQREPKGTIALELFEKGNKLIIRCTNSATAPVQFQEGIPQSPLRRGSGMSSILRTVNRYEGMADFHQSQGEFTAHIILNIGNI